MLQPVALGGGEHCRHWPCATTWLRSVGRVAWLLSHSIHANSATHVGLQRSQAWTKAAVHRLKGTHLPAAPPRNLAAACGGGARMHTTAGLLIGRPALSLRPGAAGHLPGGHRDRSGGRDPGPVLVLRPPLLARRSAERRPAGFGWQPCGHPCVAAVPALVTLR